MVAVFHYITRLLESTQYWGVEGILRGVMKPKGSTFAKGREYKNMLFKENFEFQPIYSCFLGHFAPDMCSKYLSCTKCSWQL